MSDAQEILKWINTMLIGAFITIVVAAFYYWLAAQDMKKQTAELKAETDNLWELQELTLRMLEYISRGEEVAVVRDKDGRLEEKLAVAASMTASGLASDSIESNVKLGPESRKRRLARIRRITEAIETKSTPVGGTLKSPDE